MESDRRAKRNGGIGSEGGRGGGREGRKEE